MAMQTNKNIYGNWKVYHPNGNLMFYSDEKRATWYLVRKLAIKISEQEIKLTFTPKGEGPAIDLYGKSMKDNICVVCGNNTEGLNKHHIVPTCYRRFFPEEYKNRNAHDIVPLCLHDHEKYEKEARKLKDKLAIKYGENSLNGSFPSPDFSHEQKEMIRIKEIIKSLMKYKSKMPVDKIQKLELCIKEKLELKDLPENLMPLYDSIEIIPTNKNSIKKYGELVVSNIESIQEFVEMWRKHFLDIMNPQFMPLGWDLKRNAKQIIGKK